MGRAVGIDLGTTNSVIAATEGGQPQVIPNAEGNRTTPSVVAFLENGERLVGQMARRQAILNPKGTIYSAKRFIGHKYDEVSSEMTTVSFDVVAGPEGAVGPLRADRDDAPGWEHHAAVHDLGGADPGGERGDRLVADGLVDRGQRMAVRVLAQHRPLVGPGGQQA